MKKLIALLAAVCLAFTAAAGGGYGAQGAEVAAYREKLRGPGADPYAGDEAAPAGEDGPEAEEAPPTVPAETDPEPQAEPEPGAETDPEAGAEALSVPHLDYDAMFALRAPEETVASIDGKDVSWGEYFYFLYRQAAYVEEYFSTMNMYYGQSAGWDDKLEGGGDETYAQYVLRTAQEALCQQYAVAGFCEANGIALTEEDQTGLEEKQRQDIVAYCGEDGTEEDLRAFLAQEYLTEAVYQKINREARLFERGFARLYGEGGALYDQAEALAWMEENGYLSAGHILLMTMDPVTGEALEQTAAEAKRAQAEALLEELRAINDPEALLRRFGELKERYCEDTGKADYPDGYTFTPGTMVREFEDAVTSLEEYGLSNVVQTSYGYHIILRLPLDVDKAISFSSAGEPQTARSIAANEAYVNSLRDYLAGLRVDYAEGFQPPVLTDYML